MVRQLLIEKSVGGDWKKNQPKNSHIFSQKDYGKPAIFKGNRLLGPFETIKYPMQLPIQETWCDPKFSSETLKEDVKKSEIQTFHLEEKHKLNFLIFLTDQFTKPFK